MSQITAGERPVVLAVSGVPRIRQTVSSALGELGYRTAAAESGSGGLELARRLAPDVVILDQGTPGLDAVATCRRLRAFSDAYVLILGPEGDEEGVVAGLRGGADDIAGPAPSPRELAARVEALMRRPRSAARTAEDAVVAIGEIRIEPEARRVTRAGEEVSLTRTEFDILGTLAACAGRAVSRRDLLGEVWDPSPDRDDHVLDVHVSNLRRKLEADPATPRHLVTVRGVGYRLDP